MKNELSTETNKSSKALFLLCLFPAYYIIVTIYATLLAPENLLYSVVNIFHYSFGDFLIFLSFLFIQRKRKYALSFAIITTAVQLLYCIMQVITHHPFGGRFFYQLTVFIREIFPLFLSILLIIYCVSPSTSRCYLFAGMICCVTFIINLITTFQGISILVSNELELLYIFGFLANSDVATQVMNLKSKTKKKNALSVLDRLDKLAQLKEQGILTAEEFEAKKQELMSQM